MRKILRTLAVAALAFGSFTSLAAAQVPTATGRSFTLSNAAWKVFIPSTYKPRVGNVADLLVHFHGDPQTYWKQRENTRISTRSSSP